MVELEQLNIHSSRDIIARHGLTLPELFAFSLEFYKEGNFDIHFIDLQILTRVVKYCNMMKYEYSRNKTVNGQYCGK